MALIDLLDAGLPQTFNLLKITVSVKHNKTRYTCIYKETISILNYFYYTSIVKHVLRPNRGAKLKFHSVLLLLIIIVVLFRNNVCEGVWMCA